MTQNPSTKSAHRAALTLKMFLGIYFLTTLPIMVLLGFRGLTFLIPLVAAVAVSIYIWVRADDIPGYIAGFIFYGTVLFGGIGFAVGFFGPMIFLPEANQGPLLGIFITGPAGVLIGAISGLVYGHIKARRENR